MKGKQARGFRHEKLDGTFGFSLRKCEARLVKNETLVFFVLAQNLSFVLLRFEPQFCFVRSLFDSISFEFRRLKSETEQATGCSQRQTSKNVSAARPQKKLVFAPYASQGGVKG